MQLCKVQIGTGETRVGVVANDHVRFLDLEDYVGMRCLSDVLHSDNPAGVAHDLIDDSARNVPLEEVTLLAPIDRQEVWAAGVTYKRSRQARERESVGAASFYDKVYTAARPELVLVLSPRLRLVGYTIGNDMSARDIEGENPLYLPQAKVHDRCCALGPVITLAEAMPPLDQVAIRLTIQRRGQKVFEGSTRLSEMARPLDELIQWLGRENT